MSEVKIYRAISTQEDEDGKSGGEVFAIGDGVSFTVVENGTGVWWSKNGKDLRDVVELELHPKGEGVWLPGVTINEVTDRLRQHLNYKPGTERHRESESWIKRLIQSLAQLPTGGTGGDSFTGEIKHNFVWDGQTLTEIPCPTCGKNGSNHSCTPTAKVEKPVTLVINDYSPPLSPRHAKVAIELTEEEAREIKRNFPPTSIESPSAFVRLMRKLASRIPDQLTPPLEPKVGERVVAYWRLGEGGEDSVDEFIRYTDEPSIAEQYISINHGDKAKWSDLVNPEKVTI